jgi:hypothetical protein
MFISAFHVLSFATVTSCVCILCILLSLRFSLQPQPRRNGAPARPMDESGEFRSIGELYGAIEVPVHFVLTIYLFFISCFHILFSLLSCFTSFLFHISLFHISLVSHLSCFTSVLFAGGSGASGARRSRHLCEPSPCSAALFAKLQSGGTQRRGKRRIASHSQSQRRPRRNPHNRDTGGLFACISI